MGLLQYVVSMHVVDEDSKIVKELTVWMKVCFLEIGKIERMHG